MLLATAARGLSGLAAGRVSVEAQCAFLAVIWVVFYVWSFRAMRRVSANPS